MGVYWDKRAHINQGRGGAWRATIEFKEEGRRKSRHLGYFIEKEDALAAYNWVKEHGLILVRINGRGHYQLLANRCAIGVYTGRVFVIQRCQMK